MVDQLHNLDEKIKPTAKPTDIFKLTLSVTNSQIIDMSIFRDYHSNCPDHTLYGDKAS